MYEKVDGGYEDMAQVITSIYGNKRCSSELSGVVKYRIVVNAEEYAACKAQIETVCATYGL